MAVLLIGQEIDRQRRPTPGEPGHHTLLTQCTDQVTKLRAMQAEGLTNRQIANRLNREGVPTVSGKPRWNADDVYGLTIRNAVYTLGAYK